MSRHVQIIGIMQIALGVILLAAGGFLFVTMTGAGLISGDAEALSILLVIASMLTLFFLILSVPSIIAGAGLLGMRPWARVLTLVLAALNLFNVPIGTAFGIYAFWVLLNDQTVPLFSESAG